MWCGGSGGEVKVGKLYIDVILRRNLSNRRLIAIFNLDNTSNRSNGIAVIQLRLRNLHQTSRFRNGNTNVKVMNIATGINSSDCPPAKFCSCRIGRAVRVTFSPVRKDFGNSGRLDCTGICLVSAILCLAETINKDGNGNCYQYGDDRDNDQEFSKCEPPPVSIFS